MIDTPFLLPFLYFFFPEANNSGFKRMDSRIFLFEANSLRGISDFELLVGLTWKLCNNPKVGTLFFLTYKETYSLTWAMRGLFVSSDSKI